MLIFNTSNPLDIDAKAEDNVEDISDLSEREHKIKDDATSVEVMNTLIEALEDFADRIFSILRCCRYDEASLG